LAIFLYDQHQSTLSPTERVERDMIEWRIRQTYPYQR
jgi:hypothetical protein